MGVILGVETSSGVGPAGWFTRTDSKSFLFHLGAVRSGDRRDPVVRYLAEAGATIGGLTTIVGAEEEPLDSFMARDPTEERREYWHQQHADREAAWQDPGELIQAIDGLLATLNMPSEALLELNASGDYFQEGLFLQDLRDLRQMLAWTVDNSVSQVRLVVIP